MIQVGVAVALTLDRLGIVGEKTVGHRRAIDQGHHAVHRDSGAHLRPVEGADQRLGHGQARCLNDDVIGRGRPVEQRLNGRQKIIRDGAADASIGQFHHILFRAAFDGAALDDVGINAQVAKFVDDQRQPLAAGVLQQVANGAGFASPQKSGDDGRWNFFEIAHGAVQYPVGKGKRGTSARSLKRHHQSSG